MAYSGKFLMRVPKRLHAQMAKAAKAQGMSLNQYVLYLLTERRAQGKQGLPSPRTLCAASFKFQCLSSR